VLDAVDRFYTHYCANVHRGVHALAEEATAAYEHARGRVARFTGADPRGVVFTKNATEAFNLVAYSWAMERLGPGDVLLVTEMEHHANLVPWQMVAAAPGARLRVAPIDGTGQLHFDGFTGLFNDRTRLVAITHVSNALGTIVPIRRVIETAHHAGVPVLVDGAQAVAHLGVDVRALDADFYAFSGHKLYGPTGIGVLYGREALLDAMPPWMGGGEMIRTVSYENSTWNELPDKFEAGTPNIADAIALGTALNYLMDIGLEAIEAHEHELLEYATRKLSAISGLRIVGTSPRKAAVISFVLEGIHAADAGMILDEQGIAVRVGQHCAEPVMDFFKLRATVRASLGLYNTREEIDTLETGIRKVQELFR
jgi:cysteine desulfurase/selenocysteine lyase